MFGKEAVLIVDRLLDLFKRSGFKSRIVKVLLMSAPKSRRLDHDFSYSEVVDVPERVCGRGDFTDREWDDGELEGAIDQLNAD